MKIIVKFFIVILTLSVLVCSSWLAIQKSDHIQQIWAISLILWWALENINTFKSLKLHFFVTSFIVSSIMVVPILGGVKGLLCIMVAESIILFSSINMDSLKLKINQLSIFYFSYLCLFSFFFFSENQIVRAISLIIFFLFRCLNWTSSKSESSLELISYYWIPSVILFMIGDISHDVIFIGGLLLMGASIFFSVNISLVLLSFLIFQISKESIVFLLLGPLALMAWAGEKGKLGIIVLLMLILALIPLSDKSEWAIVFVSFCLGRIVVLASLNDKIDRRHILGLTTSFILTVLSLVVFRFELLLIIQKLQIKQIIGPAVFVCSLTFFYFSKKHQMFGAKNIILPNLSVLIPLISQFQFNSLSKEQAFNIKFNIPKQKRCALFFEQEGMDIVIVIFILGVLSWLALYL